jgi:hypothetical protein
MTTAAHPSMPFATSRPGYASEEAPTSDTVQRLVEGTWASIGPRLGQPGVLTGIMVMLLFIVVVWQHPLAKAIGTEKTVPPLVPTSTNPVAAAPPNPTATTSKVSHKLPKTHPRDPFNALLASSGSGTVGTSPTTTQAVQSTGSGTATNTGTGTGTGTSTGTGGSAVHHHGSSGATPTPAGCAATHIVKPGESLWSIANAHLLGHGFHNVDTAWHALYAKNRSTIGSNPNYLVAGERLCLPS